MIDALILAGGKGTRLQSVVNDRPKVMADIGGKPYLTLLFDQLLSADVRRVILCTGYMSGYIRDFFGDKYGDLQLVYSDEPEALGTAGAIHHALSHIETDRVLVMNGDSYCNVSLKHVITAKYTPVQMVLAYQANIARYGQVTFDKDANVIQFIEKTGDPNSGWINSGIYVFDTQLIQSVPAGRFISLEKDIFPTWVQQQLVKCYFSTGQFLDIGLPESYAQIQDFIADISKPKRFVALDRDGTIIKLVRYISNVDDVELLAGVVEGLKAMRQLGLGLIVVTNQSAIGRGMIDVVRYHEITSRMTAYLAQHNLAVDGIYFCPALPEDNDRNRKPNIGMMQAAQTDFRFDFESCFVIGDNESDIDLGHNVGAKTFLVRTGYGKSIEHQVSSDYTVDSLEEASKIIEMIINSS